MDFILNGEPKSVELDEGASLLDLLRVGCGVTSVKDGCAPEGSCGACTVMVEAKAVVSCAQPAARFAGKAITTQEGLTPDQRRQWADCFVAAGASLSFAITAKLQIQSIELNGHDLGVRFRTFSGQNYSVEYSTDLTASNWLPLPGGNVSGDGHDAQVTDTNVLSSVTKFYRVKQQ